MKNLTEETASLRHIAEKAEINEEYAFWASVSRLKDPYLKFCRAFERRIRMALAEYCVIYEDENQATTVMVKGIFLTFEVGLLCQIDNKAR